jgi:membrane-bound serine protease (ClpP class)
MVLETSHQGEAADPSLKGLLGFEGLTLTPLRPSGSARIDQRQVDVISDGQFIEAGQRIRVVQVEGARVVVEPLGGGEDGSG